MQENKAGLPAPTRGEGVGVTAPNYTKLCRIAPQYMTQHLPPSKLHEITTHCP